MFAVPSLLAAMTIAGAFWVGVLAARRLRDWGDNNRMLEQGEAPLALMAASGSPSDDASVARVRARVAERLQKEMAHRPLLAKLSPTELIQFIEDKIEMPFQIRSLIFQG